MFLILEKKEKRGNADESRIRENERNQNVKVVQQLLRRLLNFLIGFSEPNRAILFNNSRIIGETWRQVDIKVDVGFHENTKSNRQKERRLPAWIALLPRHRPPLALALRTFQEAYVLLRNIRKNPECLLKSLGISQQLRNGEHRVGISR